MVIGMHKRQIRITWAVLSPLALPVWFFAASGCGILGQADFLNALALDLARAELEDIRLNASLRLDGEDIGLKNLADWDSLPLLGNDEYQQFSSYHRAPGEFSIEVGGKDFNNFLSVSGFALPLLWETTDETEAPNAGSVRYLLASVQGKPGYVSRMFFTRWSILDSGDFSPEIMRIFVDDDARPAFVLPISDIGAVDPFTPPFAGRTSSAFVSYTPISFNSGLRIEMEGACPLCLYFYHIDVKSGERATRPFSARISEDPAYSSAGDLLNRFGENPNEGFELILDQHETEIPDGGSVVLFQADGPASIELLQFEFDDVEALQSGQLFLEVTYDSAVNAAIDVPVNAFFGLRHQIAPFKTVPMRVQIIDDTVQLSCFLPMPYANDVKVAIRNEGSSSASVRTSIGVDRNFLPSPWGYLHSRFFQAVGPQPEGSAFEVVSVSGRGRYVGTFLYASGRPDRRFGQATGSLNILEGDETVIIDGQLRIPGTGTEDYFNGGFYFSEGPFNHPFSAANVVVGSNTAESPGKVSCCRWHVLSDTIDFRETFQLLFEYGADNPAIVDQYETVAYYYLDRAQPGDVNGGSVSAFVN
jgi:hypothetical protein